MKPIDVRTMGLRLLRGFLYSALVMAGGQSASAEDKPVPPEAIRRFAPLAGVWDGAGTIQMGGKTYPVKVRHEWVPVTNGWGMQIHERIMAETLGTSTGENLFGYDPNGQRVHLFTVMDDGTTHDHAGSWIDDTRLFLRQEGERDGKASSEEIAVAIDGPDTYSFRVVSVVGGQQDELGAVTMHRSRSTVVSR